MYCARPTLGTSTSSVWRGLVAFLTENRRTPSALLSRTPPNPSLTLPPVFTFSVTFTHCQASCAPSLSAWTRWRLCGAWPSLQTLLSLRFALHARNQLCSHDERSTSSYLRLYAKRRTSTPPVSASKSQSSAPKQTAGETKASSASSLCC